MAYKFRPNKITKPGIYEIRVYEDKVVKGEVKHRYKLKYHLKNVDVFMFEDTLVYRDGTEIVPIDSLWGKHHTLQRRVKQ